MEIMEVMVDMIVIVTAEVVETGVVTAEAVAAVEIADPVVVAVEIAGQAVVVVVADRPPVESKEIRNIRISKIIQDVTTEKNKA